MRKTRLLFYRLLIFSLRKIKILFKKSESIRDEADFKINYLKNLVLIYEAGFRNIHSGLKYYKRKSDTLFILGSGKTINEIPLENWNTIKNKYDSIGFNFWQMHKHVPDLYVFEPMINNRLPTFIENFNKIESDYKNVPIYVKDYTNIKLNKELINSWPKKLKDNLIPLKVYQFSSKDISKTIRVLKKSINKHKNGKSYDVYPQVKVSVNLMIAFGIILGFRKIVFCGIDLNSTDYFWEFDNELIRDNLTLPSNFHKPGSKMHRTMSRGVPISEYIYSICDEFDDIEFFTSSENSLLAEKLRVYDFLKISGK